MKKTVFFAIAALCLLGITSCEEKKKTKDIIATKPVVKPVQSGPKKMSEFERTEKVEWGGETYKAQRHRQ